MSSKTQLIMDVNIGELERLVGAIEKGDENRELDMLFLRELVLERDEVPEDLKVGDEYTIYREGVILFSNKRPLPFFVEGDGEKYGCVSLFVGYSNVGTTFIKYKVESLENEH